METTLPEDNRTNQEQSGNYYGQPNQSGTNLPPSPNQNNPLPATPTQIPPSQTSSKFISSQVVSEQTNHDQTIPPSKKGSCWKTCGLFILIIFIILGGVYGVWQFRIRTAKDISPVNRPELKLNMVKLAAENNAYEELEKAAMLLSYPTEAAQTQKIDNIYKGQTWDEQFTKNLISKNQQALNHFDLANEKSKFQDPAFSDPTKVTAASISPINSKIRQLTKLKLLQGELKYKQNYADEAILIDLGVVEIGQKIEDSQGSMITYLIGLAVKKMALTNMNRYITSGKISSSTSKKVKSDMAKYLTDRKGLKLAYKNEYVIFSSEINNLSSGLVTNVKKDPKYSGLSSRNFYFEPNKTNNILADWMVIEIANADKNCGNFTQPKNTDISKYSKWRLLWLENAIGEILFSMVTEAFRNVQDKRCQNEKLSQEIYTKLK